MDFSTLDYNSFDNEIKKDRNTKWIKKLENIRGHFEYNSDKILKKPEDIVYEDSYLTLKGKLHPVHLFDLNDSDEVVNKLIKPTLNIYREG